MENVIIYVKDYSLSPGSRELDEGKKAHSGEEYREQYLEPKFREALKIGAILEVNLDGTIGYGTSWLEEVFGGLTRNFNKETVKRHLKIVSVREPYLIEDIDEYIDNA